MSKHYPVEQRERAVKMVLDHLGEYRSMYGACQARACKLPHGPTATGRPPRWRFDRMSTVAQPQSGISFGPIARHYAVGIDVCPAYHP